MKDRGSLIEDFCERELPMAIFKQMLSSELNKKCLALCAVISIIILCELVFDIFLAFYLISLPCLIAGSAAGALAYAKAVFRSSSDGAPHNFSAVTLLWKLLIGLTAAFLLSAITAFGLAVILARNWTSDADRFFIDNFMFLPFGLLLAFASAVLLSAISRAYRLPHLSLSALLFVSQSDIAVKKSRSAALFQASYLFPW
jgi:hypothetical protein